MPRGLILSYVQLKCYSRALQHPHPSSLVLSCRSFEELEHRVQTRRNYDTLAGPGYPCPKRHISRALIDLRGVPRYFGTTFKSHDPRVKRFHWARLPESRENTLRRIILKSLISVGPNRHCMTHQEVSKYFLSFGGWSTWTGTPPKTADTVLPQSTPMV